METNPQNNESPDNSIATNSAKTSNQPVLTSSNLSNQKEHRKVGPIIASLIIVLILVIAGLYLFASQISQNNDSSSTFNANNINQINDTTAIQSIQPITNNTDDPQSLKDDLDNSMTGIDNQNF